MKAKESSKEMEERWDRTFEEWNRSEYKVRRKEKVGEALQRSYRAFYDITTNRERILS